MVRRIENGQRKKVRDDKVLKVSRGQRIVDSIGHHITGDQNDFAGFRIGRKAGASVDRVDRLL